MLRDVVVSYIQSDRSVEFFSTYGCRAENYVCNDPLLTLIRSIHGRMS